MVDGKQFYLSVLLSEKSLKILSFLQKSPHFLQKLSLLQKSPHFLQKLSLLQKNPPTTLTFTKSPHFLQTHLTFTKSSHSSHFYKIPLLLTFTKTSAFTKSSQFYINPLTTLTYKILLLLQSPSFSLVVIRVLQKLFGL